MKICNTCERARGRLHFSKCTSNKDGLQYQCKDCKISYSKRLRNEHPERDAKYRQEHKEERALYNREYKRKKYADDMHYRLTCCLRRRQYNALNYKQNTAAVIKSLGCSITEALEYLETKFQEGMTWDNWTVDGWHVDHIIPLAAFDLRDKRQYIEAFHYTNLQPLWAKDNLSKGALADGRS